MLRSSNESEPKCVSRLVFKKCSWIIDSEILNGSIDQDPSRHVADRRVLAYLDAPANWPTMHPMDIMDLPSRGMPTEKYEESRV